MPDVTETVDVHVPIRTAYNQWTQFESFPQFMDGVESVRQIDDRHTHWVTSVAGVRREFDAEITEQHPDERVAWKSTGGDSTHAGVITFHRLGDQDTRVTVQLAWQPDGVVEKVGAVLGVDDRQVKADTRRFKEFIERDRVETGRWRGEVPAPGADGPGQTADRTADPTAPESGSITRAAATDSHADDVIDVLLAQHEEIRQAFTRVHTATVADKAGLFANLVALLRLHETAEQTVVHPVARAEVSRGDEVVGQRVAEETEADRVIARLSEMGTDHAGFDTAFAVFHQAVLDHAENEETQEFPQLRRNVPADTLHALAAQLRAVQNSQL